MTPLPGSTYVCRTTGRDVAEATATAGAGALDLQVDVRDRGEGRGGKRHPEEEKGEAGNIGWGDGCLL